MYVNLYACSLDQILKVIGYGGFGKISLVRPKGRQETFALKALSKAAIGEDHVRQSHVLAERDALASVESKFILKLTATYQDKNFLFFLTDVLLGGDMIEYLTIVNILDVSATMFYTANVALGLGHLHDAGFVHRDLKPENLLIGANGYVKICDLGLARRLPVIKELEDGGLKWQTKSYTICGSPDFLPPELLLNHGCDHRADWWALGCIVHEMLFAKSAFDCGQDLRALYIKVWSVQFMCWEEEWWVLDSLTPNFQFPTQP